MVRRGRFAGKRRVAVRAAWRERVASRLPSSEGLGGGLTYLIQVTWESLHCRDFPCDIAKLYADTLPCG